MSATPRKMMGIESPSDQKVPITVRDWNAMKLAIWRGKTSLSIIERAAAELLPSCRHREGCPGAGSNSEPCFKDDYEMVFEAPNPDIPAFDHKLGAEYVDQRTSLAVKSSRLVVSGCPDRELRMSLLVILGASKTLTPVDARRPSGDLYMAPSREYYSDVIAELGSLQLKNEILSQKMREIGIDPDQLLVENLK